MAQLADPLVVARALAALRSIVGPEPAKPPARLGPVPAPPPERVAEPERDWFTRRVADCERRFGPGAGYLALLGRLVTTPRGTGRVVQASRDRLAVDLGETAPDWRGDARRVVSFFNPREVEVIQ